jgi:transcriptional regulator with XRE-family HTH domain
VQAIFLTKNPPGYAALVQTGRPSKEPRTPFGARLHAAREAAGLTQAQLADKIGVTQTAYGVWERYPVALRPEQIEQLASLLNVSVEHLFGRDTAKPRGKGPAGKLRQVFEKASQLPRHQQNKVAEFVGAFVKQQGNGDT